MRRPAISALLLASVLAGCGGDSGAPPAWSDASDVSWPLVDEGRTVQSEDDYRMLIGDDPMQTGRPADRCLQLVVGSTPIGCVGVDPPPGGSHGFSAAVRTEDARVVWRAETTPADPDQVPDHYVVWSSSAPSGRRVEPIVRDAVTNLVWIMEPGEQPWGVQTIAADGTLLRAESLVGLPGE